ncbi:MAG: M24 family metallopeptidase [Nocardioidaceae bacterium]
MTEQAPPPGEREQRLQRVRARMAQRSLSALVVTDPANLYYLTGYDAWSFYMPQALVVPAEGEMRLYARSMDAAGACFTADLAPEQVDGYPESLVHRPDIHPFEWITTRAVERGVLVDRPGSTIAVEGDSHFFTARAYQSLVAGLQHARVVDSDELVNWVRLVKSEHEVERLRIAGSIAGRAMTAALDAIRPGRRQCDVVAEILAAQATGTPEHGGDYPAIVPMLPTGETAGTPHLTWSEVPFERDQATTIELAGVYDRYHAPIARTVMLGNPPSRLADMAKIIQEGLVTTLDATGPGATGGDVHAAFNTVISAHGLTKESRVGYSIGIGYPPDWGERTVSLRHEEQTVLAPGMAFHVILGMWMDGWGYELSEPVIVTASGVEHLADVPEELVIRK